MSDERCSDLLCTVCAIRDEIDQRQIEDEVWRRVLELLEDGDVKLYAWWKPLSLKQRIWSKFTTLAQWVRPGKN